MPVKAIPQEFVGLIETVEASYFAMFEKGYAKKCTGETCTFGEVCTHKRICALRCLETHKKLPAKCQQLLDEYDKDFLDMIEQCEREKYQDELWQHMGGSY